MKLSGNQYRSIQSALAETFTRSELAQLARHDLDHNLDAIAGGSNLTEVIFNLIGWAQRTGQVQALIVAAANARPDDIALAELNCHLAGTHPSDSRIQPAEEGQTPMTPELTSLSQHKRVQLEKRLRLLVDQYEAANTQYDTTLDAAARVTLDARIKDLERQIEQVETDLAALSDTRSDDATPAARDLRYVVPTESPHAVVNTGRALALLVGVNVYEDAFIADLSAAVKDVTAVSELLAVRYDTVRLLTDGTQELPPTRRNILAQLRLLAENADEGDLLLFHFSGHGIAEAGSSYLLPCDAATTALSDTAVAMDRVRAIMAASSARAKVIILDACHSGASIGRAAAVMTPEFIEHVFEQAEGLVVLASCKQGQQSWEWPEKGHGVFTYYLLEALNGQADFGDKRFVTVDDASRYVTDGVRRWAMDNHAVQTPTKQVEMVGDIVIMDYRNRSSD